MLKVCILINQALTTHKKYIKLYASISDMKSFFFLKWFAIFFLLLFLLNKPKETNKIESLIKEYI